LESRDLGGDGEEGGVPAPGGRHRGFSISIRTTWRRGGEALLLGGDVAAFDFDGAEAIVGGGGGGA